MFTYLIAKLIGTTPAHLKQAIADVKKEQEIRERQAKMHNLQLCSKHQPVNPGAHYSEHNCNYCAALKKLAKAGLADKTEES